jgi:hypothetical protein
VLRDAVNQTDYMRAIVGDDTASLSECYSMFLCGLPGVSEFASGTKTLDQLRKEVADAGY